VYDILTGPADFTPYQNKYAVLGEEALGARDGLLINLFDVPKTWHTSPEGKFEIEALSEDRFGSGPGHHECQSVMMKKLALVLFIAALAYGYVQEQGIFPPWSPASVGSNTALQDAIATRQSNVQVKGEGIVTKVLKDDLDGSRHQRFILKLGSGQTLLVAHNIDLAPRIDTLRSGDSVEFYGEYEWNPKGGVIHWTHHDPQGRHPGGWLRHRGKTYQ